MDAIPAVDIDCGIFKYVLIRVEDPADGSHILVVRGYCEAEYHGMLLFPLLSGALGCDFAWVW